MTKDDLLHKLARFCSFEAGWHFGEGVPTDPEVRIRSLKIIDIACANGWDTEIFPGVSGEILLDLERGGVNYEFILETDGSVSLHREDEGVDIEWLERVDDSVAIERL